MCKKKPLHNVSLVRKEFKKCPALINHKYMLVY